eukprot:4842397-Amphidinium_carterae.1
MGLHVSAATLHSCMLGALRRPRVKLLHIGQLVRHLRALTLQDAHSAAAMHGGSCLSRTYEGIKEPLKWRCSAGHEWTASLSNVRNSQTWCP